MPKIFYTERDIEDMVKRSIHSLTVGDDEVLTDLAYEKAKRLGLELIQPQETPPAAPVRPYINEKKDPVNVRLTEPTPRLEEIKQRVYDAVRTRLGNDIDQALLDKIIERVAADIGMK